MATCELGDQETLISEPVSILFELGDQETLTSEPVSILWGTRQVAVPMIPWAVFLVLFLLGMFRTRQSLWLLLPVALHLLLWHGIGRVIEPSMGNMYMAMMEIFDRSMLMGMSILWILGVTLGVRLRLIRASVLLWLVVWCSSLFFSGFDSLYLVGGAAVGAMASLTIVGSTAFALRMTRHRFNGFRFFLWIVLFMVMCGICFSLPDDHLMGGAIGYFARMLGWTGSVDGMYHLLFAAVLGIALAGAALGVYLPFLIPMLLIPSCRRSFMEASLAIGPHEQMKE